MLSEGSKFSVGGVSLSLTRYFGRRGVSTESTSSQIQVEAIFRNLPPVIQVEVLLLFSPPVLQVVVLLTVPPPVLQAVIVVVCRNALVQDDPRRCDPTQDDTI